MIGEKIALTPPMGWNSWNCWSNAIDDAKVRASAKAMVESGLINHGWTYMNIDDCWQGRRGGTHNAIQPNEKFPDMKKLVDYVHGLGLKIGIYSTPWITSYAGFCGGSSDNQKVIWSNQKKYQKDWRHGKFKYDTADVTQWAEWGIDYLKYDWNPNDILSVNRMANALRNSGRDIIYSLSNSAPFDKADAWARLANCWRTTGDIRDNWASMSEIGFSQNKWAEFAGPGHWNDPDMLVVGYVGWGPELHLTRLTPNEQYTHISLWCLLSAPLLLGCPIDQLDEFTISLLTNDEVLEVNQDALGKQAIQITKKANLEVWVKEMEGGVKAVGLFNRGTFENTLSIQWKDLGINGEQIVRDLWRQKDLGTFLNEFKVKLPRHSVMLVKLTPKEKNIPNH